jgi:hypothetical protein
MMAAAMAVSLCLRMVAAVVVVRALPLLRQQAQSRPPAGTGRRPLSADHQSHMRVAGQLVRMAHRLLLLEGLEEVVLAEIKIQMARQELLT